MRIDVPEEYTDRLLIGDTVLVKRITFTISEFIRTVGHTDEPHDARPPVLLLQPALEHTIIPNLSYLHLLFTCFFWQRKAA